MITISDGSAVVVLFKVKKNVPYKFLKFLLLSIILGKEMGLFIGNRKSRWNLNSLIK